MKARHLLWLTAFAAAAVLFGCGGGGGATNPIGGSGGGSGISLTEQATARVDVDLKTGKVLVTPMGQAPAQSRSLYTGAAVSVASSSVFNDTSELTIRKLNLSITNNTPDTIGLPNGAQMVIDRVGTDHLGFDLRSQTLASTAIGPGSSAADGPGPSVTINNPSGIARDIDGALYIAGQGDGSLRKMKDNFVTRIATGIATPGGVAVLPNSGFAFMLEQSTHNLVRVPTNGGAKFVLAGGGASGLVDGTGAAARFNGPRDLAILGTSAYVADFLNDRIRKVDNLTGASGNVTTVNVFPVITSPSGIAVMSLGGIDWLVVCSTQTHRVFLVNAANGQSFQIAGTGVTGTTDGFGNVAQFNQPSDVAVVGSTIFVAEVGNRMIRQISLKTGAEPKFASSWVVKTIAGIGGTGNDDGNGFEATFTSPRFIVADGSGALYVTDLSSNRTRKITPVSGVLPITGSGGSGGSVQVANPDGFIPDPSEYQNRKAKYEIPTLQPSGAAGATIEKTVEFTVGENVTAFYFFVSIVGATGSVAALDGILNSTTSLKGSPFVNVRTLTGGQSGFGDGSETVARFHGANVFAAGNGLYVADVNNELVRRVDLNTGITKTIVGLAKTGTVVAGSGTTSSTPFPQGIWLNETETEGFIGLVAHNVILRISRPPASDPSDSNSWTVALVAGTPTTSGVTNGPGNTALIGRASGLTADPTGSTVTFCDATNNQIRQMKIAGGLNRNVAANWTVSLLAGDSAGAAGDVGGFGTSARFREPRSIALSKDGNLYVVESVGNRLRRIEPSLQVILVAGSSIAASGSQDGVGAAALFSSPSGIALDESGHGYVTDITNRVVRRVHLISGETRTTAGQSIFIGSVDGFGNSSTFNSLTNCSFMPGRGLFLGDAGTIRIVERVVRNGLP